MSDSANAIPPSYRLRFSPWMKQTPVDVKSVAHEIGLSIFALDLPAGVSGMIVRGDALAGDSGFVVYVDKNEPGVRQRFTAAHEIGHFVLHKDQIGDGHADNHLLRAEGYSNYQEAEANRFAADLLMPRELIAQRMAEGVNTVEALAKEFGVSQIAMGIRLGLPT